MYFLLGRRYPSLGAVAGGVLIVSGVAFHNVTVGLAGAVVLTLGVIRSIAAWRKAAR
jgi:hypothetical protein